MPFCQVIKSNNAWCCNYARKGLTCCWSHRKLENDKVEMVVDEPEEVVELIQVVEEPKKDDNAWPPLEETVAEIKLHGIDCIQNLHSYAINKNMHLLSKYERRLVALTISEAVMSIQIPDEIKLSVKRLITVMYTKLAEYDIGYIKRLVKFHNSI